MDREPDQRPDCAQLITLTNKAGDRVELLQRGALIQSIALNLVSGPRNVALSYEAPSDYADDRFFLGATVGRFANRIGNACFELDGTLHRLQANEGKHQLHGGHAGFHARDWQHAPATTSAGAASQSARFTLQSAAGDQGFPGNLNACVEYSLSDDRELLIRYQARTDQATPVSLTNHCYFNLDGASGSGSSATTISKHCLQMNADGLLETDPDKIPTGKILDLDGSALSLREFRNLGEILDSGEALIERDGGLDVCYVARNAQPVARLRNAADDLEMTVTTSYPAIQCYTGQYLGEPFVPLQGLCLEPQQYPDAPNQPGFPCSILRPGEEFSQWIRLGFTEKR